RTWSSSATSASRTTLWNHRGKSSARVGEMPVFALPSICSLDGPRARTILAQGAAKGLPAAVRARPLGPAAAPDQARPTAAALDDPERGGLRAPGGAARLPRHRPLVRC